MCPFKKNFTSLLRHIHLVYLLVFIRFFHRLRFCQWRILDFLLAHYRLNHPMIKPCHLRRVLIHCLWTGRRATVHFKVESWVESRGWNGENVCGAGGEFEDIDGVVVIRATIEAATPEESVVPECACGQVPARSRESERLRRHDLPSLYGEDVYNVFEIWDTTITVVIPPAEEGVELATVWNRARSQLLTRDRESEGL